MVLACTELFRFPLTAVVFADADVGDQRVQYCVNWDFVLL